VRIDRQGDKLVRVPDDQLQEKSHFPFVFEALSLPDGEVYVSEFGINHEDAAQEAAVPVFNMASPVVQGGQLRGVVVVRVAAAPFLQNFNAALPTPYGFYLSNRWGDFLVHPDAAQTFGFDRGQRILIQESFPQVAALVDGRAEEAVLSQPGTDDEEARVFAFVRMPFGNAEEGRFMVVGLSQPLAVVFTVLCENVDSEEAALQIVTKLQHAFEPPLAIDGEPLAVRASIGLSLFPRDAQDARTLMASADAAMYRIKQGHKRRL